MNEERRMKRCMQEFLSGALTKVYLSFGVGIITALVVMSAGYFAEDPGAQSSETKTQLGPEPAVVSEVSERRADGTIQEGEYPHELVLAEGKFTVYWRNNSGYLYMALKGRTTGWVAIGFEPTSRMKDADMVFGWVEEDDRVMVLDLYATGRFGPHPPDEELGGTNDLLDAGGKEDNGYTIIEFKRKMNTADSYDKVLTAGQTVRFIWAMATRDSLTVKHNILKGSGELVLEEAKPGSARAWMDIELKDAATGEKFKIRDFKGTPILLESFAVWCPTCLRQQKAMQELKAREGERVVHISLDTDPNEDEAKIKEHAQTHGLDWHFAVSPLELTKALMDEFGLRIVSAPSAPVLLICEDQSTRFLRSGVKSADELLSEINKGC